MLVMPIDNGDLLDTGEAAGYRMLCEFGERKLLLERNSGRFRRYHASRNLHSTDV